MALFVVLLICSVFVDVHRSVSGQSSCKCSSQQLDCSGQNLTSLHETLQSHLNCEGASRFISVNDNKLKNLNFPKEFMQRNRNATIYAPNNHLTSLNGLEDWTGSLLNIRGNNFSSIDISPLKKNLQDLDISFNHLSSLDLSSMENLSAVYASFNSLSHLILPSERCSLKKLNLHSNKLSVIPMDLRKCVDLTDLYVNRNNLSSLDLSIMENLSVLLAYNNFLSHLILPSERCSLQRLDLHSNKLSVLAMDLRKCVHLTDLYVNHNNLSSLDLSSMENLSNVYAHNNSLSHLILPSERCSLKRLELHSNKLSVIPMDLRQCMDLTYLYVNHNNLSSLDLSSMENLFVVSAHNNSLSHLILPNKRCSLHRIDLISNKFLVIPRNLRKCKNLTRLELDDNNLVELDLSEMFRLEYVAATRNTIKTLILPNESCSIERFMLNSNKLTSLPEILSLCSQLRNIHLNENSLKVFPEPLLNLMKLRPDVSRSSIYVDVRRNPLTLLEIFPTFRNFIQQDLFVHLFDEDFFTIKESGCECSRMKLYHFAPVEYCATIMCDKGENLWQHL